MESNMIDFMSFIIGASTTALGIILFVNVKAWLFRRKVSHLIDQEHKKLKDFLDQAKADNGITVITVNDDEEDDIDKRYH